MAGEQREWEPGYGYCARNDHDNEMLAAALEVVRRSVCAYGPDARTCDCKYGAGRKLIDGDKEAGRLGSERTGCPELREMIHKLLHREGAVA